jgi:APA family basic amino acid/polyamine antiporter
VAAPLVRRLGTSSAVVLGLASMIGAGVFTAFAPAAAAAGPLLVVGLAIAAGVAFCNATSTAQLAAVHPVAGGVYAYGRAELGPWWGFLAGWGFVVGKTASVGAMALTAAAYLAPPEFGRPSAVLAILAITGINLLGVSRTAAAAAILVTLALAGIAVATAGAFSDWDGARIAGPSGGPYEVLQAAGLLFFAFAGYARIATLGEEVREPARTIPRAIGIALLLVVAIYTTVGIALLGALGPDRLAQSNAPLEDAAAAAGWDWALPLIATAAGVASLGSLLALTAGLGRTVLAMARTGDLPRPLAVVTPRTAVPLTAQVVVAGCATLLVIVADVRTAIGFSSFGVLLYYLVANLAAFRQRGPARRSPRALQVAGGLGCALLVATVPVPALIAGVAVLGIGVAYRLVRLRTGR